MAVLKNVVKFAKKNTDDGVILLVQLESIGTFYTKLLSYIFTISYNIAT